MSEDYEASLEKMRQKFKKEEVPIVKISEEMLVDELKKEFKQKKRDFLFKSTSIAKKLNGSPYVVRDLIPKLEEKNLVEKTDFSRGPIIWVTKFKVKK